MPSPLLLRLHAGEDSRHEFKELRFGKRSVISPNAEDFATEMTAFANAEGGTLFLGVGDEGVAVGIPREKLDLAEQWVLNIATQNCDPPIRPEVRREVVETSGGDQAVLLLVVVPRGLYAHCTSSGRYYARFGSTKRRLTSPELARFFQERGREYVFDEQRVAGATVDDLDWNRLESFFGRSPRIPWLELLRNTSVTVLDHDGRDRPTVAGLLAFAANPPRSMPSAHIEAARYAGTRLSSDDLVHAEKLAGPAPDQIDAAVAFVMHYMNKGRARSAGDPYDIDVVDEAMVNAVAHRDYSVSGSKIRLFLYADRLELHSPGGLPNGITVEQMPYRTFTRNQLLVGFLSRIRSKRTGEVFLESRGEGVRKILEDGEKHSGRPPVYELFGNELRLTIWGAE